MWRCRLAIQAPASGTLKWDDVCLLSQGSELPTLAIYTRLKMNIYHTKQ